MPTQRTLLFYVHALSGGGAERVMARLASGFAARGDRVLLAVDFEAQEWRSSLDESVELIVLPGGHARNVAALADILARERPFVSVSALAATNLKHAAAAMLARRSSRAILSHHGFFENEPERLSRIGYLSGPALSRLVAANVAVSDALARDLVRRFFFPIRRTVTIYNPASLEAAQPPLSPAALRARPPLIVAMGRLTEDKGFGFLVRAFGHVGYPGARLAILGKGPELDKLKAMALALGVADRLELPGYVDPSGYLSRARCFVSPSLRESFGLAIVEALDYGLPVVATGSGGPQEILCSPELGRLVPFGDEKQTAAAIGACLEAPGDPAPRQRRAKAFSLDAALDNYDRLFFEVAPRAAHPRQTG